MPSLSWIGPFLAWTIGGVAVFLLATAGACWLFPEDQVSDEEKRVANERIEELEALLLLRSARISALEVALRDCLSTYRDDGKEVLVTAERQECWLAVLEDE